MLEWKEFGFAGFEKNMTTKIMMIIIEKIAEAVQNDKMLRLIFQQAGCSCSAIKTQVCEHCRALSSMKRTRHSSVFTHAGQ